MDKQLKLLTSELHDKLDKQTKIKPISTNTKLSKTDNNIFDKVL